MKDEQSLAGYVRQHYFSLIGRQKRDGVKQSVFIKELTELGFTVNLKTYRNALGKAKSWHAKNTVSPPVKTQKNGGSEENSPKTENVAKSVLKKQANPSTLAAQLRAAEDNQYFEGE